MKKLTKLLLLILVLSAISCSQKGTVKKNNVDSLPNFQKKKREISILIDEKELPFIGKWQFVRGKLFEFGRLVSEIKSSSDETSFWYFSRKNDSYFTAVQKVNGKVVEIKLLIEWKLKDEKTLMIRFLEPGTKKLKATLDYEILEKRSNSLTFRVIQGRGRVMNIVIKKIEDS